MIIARDVKIVPRATDEWDNTSSAITLFARVAYSIFSTIVHNPQTLLNHFFFCSTLSEFDNFLLCERVLINVT
jgi:hypothetical protein